MEDGTNQEISMPNQIRSEPSVHENDHKRQFVIFITLGVLLILVVLIGGLYFLLSPSTSAVQVGRIRDIFIIFMALQSLLIGFALVILLIQIAQLINLLNNEVRPILNSTNETVNTLRGTTAFLSDNLVQPIIKLNEYLAGIQEMFKLFKLKKK
jgi:predicted PurR-regulated permease PerM